MAEVITDHKDLEFVLFEQLDISSILSSERYADVDDKTARMMIREARQLAIREILPTFVQGDREGVHFDRGKVSVPPCFHKAHAHLVQGEWGGLTADPDYGGQGLPHVVAQGAMEYLIGANYSLMTYLILGNGAGKMVQDYGSDIQKNQFLEKMLTGEWGSTMVLTEPEAGSDLGALTTTAVKDADGTYRITGNKIFITNGAQDITPNIIHPVLARIEGAPPGTRGISIFLVPARWVNEDGSLGEDNDVVCTGVEEKMGIHGSPTCSLSFGQKGGCRGLLLGRPGQGMEIMFQMMNEVRLEVGTQAFTHASCSYLQALEYARTRRQGRRAGERDPEAPVVPIIEHPDVRRMLMNMKALVEGMRSLTCYTAFCLDMMHCADDEAERRRYTALTEILTPVVKAYCSERGHEVCVEGMQVLGGYGYTRDYPMEQLVRDCKICSIYEGTNGIQAMDFLGRKIAMDRGNRLEILMKEIRKTVDQARAYTALTALADAVIKAAEVLEKTLLETAPALASPQAEAALSHAHPLMTAAGEVILGWMHLWRAVTALPALEKVKKDADLPAVLQENKTAAFYHGKVMTARYFIETRLPSAVAAIEGICLADSPALLIRDAGF